MFDEVTDKPKLAPFFYGSRCIVDKQVKITIFAISRIYVPDNFQTLINSPQVHNLPIHILETPRKSTHNF